MTRERCVLRGDGQVGKSLVAIYYWPQSLALLPTVRGQSKNHTVLGKDVTTIKLEPQTSQTQHVRTFSLGSYTVFPGSSRRRGECSSSLLTHGFRVSDVIAHCSPSVPIPSRLPSVREGGPLSGESG